MTNYGVIIVGAGQAGCSAAVKLRNLGYDKPIALIGEEAHPPYQRPPLSKAYLLGKLPRDRLFLRPESFFDEHQVDLHLNQRVTDISVDDQTLVCDDQTLAFEHLVLATGSTPNRLPESIGGSLTGTYTIRGIADIDAIAPEFKQGRKVAIIGGGYIGLEVAAVAAKLDLDVTLIEAAPRILQRVASPETAKYFRELHDANNVRILEGTKIARVTGEGRADGAELANGDVVPADFVVLGIGITPNTALAETAGVTVENGIKTDALGRTSHPCIWAAGDCATFPHGNAQIRLESVGNAIDQAETVAENIMGATKPYKAKPWFWSDQYHVKLQIAGLNAGYDQVVSREGDDGSYSVWYYCEGKLIATDAMNDPRAYMVAKRLIESGKSPHPEMVADRGTDLKSILKV
ncbi:MULTISPECIES: NAD(P)/FAD-dependent oxidoreductase [unclassified Ruegeria]|uniref:NAD(P)/FAD-dependent oxidoreductase n=1 Tax=unclassified Ruegeria TaxID=2625375 RepID=UPI001491EF36|nr:MULTISPECIES: FAD-dependent oxidoreductase [unclassified Ruegeria]NOD47704.1 FAD-dependent oxidoreductase [Ruegeria sp. HKCCD5849]NOD52633.1 FAD-dependent oxidoreductase [Ruegeria sp. HKCCD5851]NOD66052.1 FAD-dependent oxidoreductase [Ruegeria sp. HKCCD7303]